MGDDTEDDQQHALVRAHGGQYLFDDVCDECEVVFEKVGFDPSDDRWAPACSPLSSRCGEAVLDGEVLGDIYGKEELEQTKLNDEISEAAARVLGPPPALCNGYGALVEESADSAGEQESVQASAEVYPPVAAARRGKQRRYRA